LLSQKQEVPKSAVFDRKIEQATSGLAASCAKALYSLSEVNATIIADYMTAIRFEINPSDQYRKSIIETLSVFTKFTDNKSFKYITKGDILSFLESFRKTDAADPLHKWIGTYNVFRMHLLRFFKWFYSPELEPAKRPKPSLLENIPKLKRKEISIYKPSDLWTQQDDLLFLKFCRSSRDRCYHALSRDLSCRPSEILRLKIRDISFKTIGSSQYAEVVVNGKTGNRPIPLINSIPYLKDYLDHEHPQPRNPTAPKIQPGEKVVWLFNAENIEPVEQEFNGRKVQKFQYAVVDPNKPSQEKYWTANKVTSEQIDAFLNEGHSILKIQRIGSGTDTRYNIMAA
jgi:integrase